MIERIVASLLVSVLAIITIGVVVIYALSQGHDGAMVMSGCGAIGAVVGWFSRKMLRE